MTRKSGTPASSWMAGQSFGGRVAESDRGLADRCFTLRLADGSIVTGPIHGSGGVVGRGEQNTQRIRLSIQRANDGRPLAIYEPKPGHCAMYLDFKGENANEQTPVDLCGAEVIA